MAGILRAEISAAALRHNVERIRGAIGPDVEICAVVKADAYGHGMSEVVPVLAPLVDRLAVTLPPSALRLRELGWEGPILTFFRAAGAAPADELNEVLAAQVAAGVTLTATGVEDLSVIEAAAARAGHDAEVHLKVDTGMTRSGVLASEAADLLARLSRSPSIRTTGLYTQLASADAVDLTSARDQLALFDRVEADREGLVLHAANSAGMLALEDSHYDMVRPGLALYGCYPSPEMRRPLDLRPVLRLTARLLEVKLAPAGSRTGYGGAHTFSRETPIGLVSVGYADGYPRMLGGRAMMGVGGTDVPVCGRVSMDQVVVDLSAVEGALVGDEVEVISRDPRAPHCLERLAALAATIPYEIICGLGKRVERVLVDE